MEPRVIGPQPGPQTKFLSSKAEVLIYGGAAGGGKSFGLLLDPLRNIRNPNFHGMIFRRNSVQVRAPGGLWDQSMRLYPIVGGDPSIGPLEWKFPSGMTMKFGHLERDLDVLNWQGSEMDFIGWDELTHFSEYQFFYMLSRNRSTSNSRPCMRAGCNPDFNSFVRKLIDWWIGPDGLPIPERAGILRYFARIEDTLYWGSTAQELIDVHGPDTEPKSFTFIPAYARDNKILLAKTPGYIASLKALPRVERERLLGGNWNVVRSGNDYFNRNTIEVIDTLPANPMRTVRYWDRAATKPSSENRDPDWTRGLKMHRYMNGIYVVSDVAGLRDSPLNVQTLITNTASQDTYATEIYVEQDPGSAGVADADNYIRLLSAYPVYARRVTKDKVTRALAVSAQCEAGNVKVLRGAWNDAFFAEIENFPNGAHDDQVDVLSGAYNELAEVNLSILDVL